MKYSFACLLIYSISFFFLKILKHCESLISVSKNTFKNTSVPVKFFQEKKKAIFCCCEWDDEIEKYLHSKII